jgi:hypothetical protein
MNTSRTHHGAGDADQLRLPRRHKSKNLIGAGGENSTVLLGGLTTQRKQSGVDDEAVADVDAMETVGAGRLETLVSSSRTTQHIIR